MRRMALVVLCLWGCAGNRPLILAWEHTRAVDDIRSYRGFLLQYPEAEEEGAFAEKRIEELRWGDAQSADTIEGYMRYLVAAPEGAHRDWAYRRIEELDFQLALAEGTAAALEGYLTRNRGGSRSGLVAEALEEARFQDAVQRGTADSYGSYLLQYPSGEHADAARVERERAAFVEAGKRNSVTGYQSYLRKFPAGEHAVEARARIAGMRFRRLRVVVNITDSWLAPEHRRSAATSLRQVVDFTVARAMRRHGFRTKVEVRDVADEEPDGAHPFEWTALVGDEGLLVISYKETVSPNQYATGRATDIHCDMALYSPASRTPVFQDSVRASTATRVADASEDRMHASAIERLGLALISVSVPGATYYRY
jgi:hypothetical protein